jgi:hypothetical protein
VNGVGGLIILPDSWILPSSCLFTAGFANSWRDWTHNSYTLAQWADMEAAGAVFLPAACSRLSSYVVNGNIGFYWGATLDAMNMNYAHYLFISSDGLGHNSYYLYNGYSVRLVQDN